MRKALAKVEGVPDHLGLAYDAWAPVAEGGKVADGQRADWLSKLADLKVSPDYARAFERWMSSFAAPGDRSVEVTLASRLLVGHGNVGATGVGLTVHHTWGVPVIPGSALKGLLAHYVDAVYGPADSSLPPWEQPDGERDRARYQGVTWRDDGRIERGPGEVHRALFGAPDAEGDAAMREHEREAGAAAGLVAFHDALYVPQSAKDDKPFAVDVLTVHQKGYYDSSGGSWPNDYDKLNPVAFLTVRPGTRMRVALSGLPGWTELAERLLKDALEQWGVGGKTSSGYGRVLPQELGARPATRTGSFGASAPTTSLKAKDRVEAVLLEERTKRGGWKARHELSGLAGAIQNSASVPSDKKPGDRVTLIVKIAKGHDSAFEFPPETDAARPMHREKK